MDASAKGPNHFMINQRIFTRTALLVALLGAAPVIGCAAPTDPAEPEASETLAAKESALAAPPTCEVGTRAAYEAAKAALQAAMARESAAAATIAAQKAILSTSTSAVARAAAQQALVTATAEYTAAQAARSTAQVALHYALEALAACLGVVFAWVSMSGTASAAEYHPLPPTSTLECMAAEDLVSQIEARLATVRAARAANELACTGPDPRTPENCATLRARYSEQEAAIEQELRDAKAAFESCIRRLDPTRPPPGSP